MKQLKLYIIIGIIFVLITGTLAHFVYEWSGRNFFAGFFFPVNESTWEHMKLLFFPMLLYSFFMQQRLNETSPCIKSASFAGVLFGTLLIPVIFYTYTGILGRNYLLLDILTFILSTISAFYLVYRLALSCGLQSRSVLLKLLICIFIAGFILFTYNPPDIGLFANPIK